MNKTQTTLIYAFCSIGSGFVASFFGGLWVFVFSMLFGGVVFIGIREESKLKHKNRWFQLIVLAAAVFSFMLADPKEEITALLCLTFTVQTLIFRNLIVFKNSKVPYTEQAIVLIALIVWAADITLFPAPFALSLGFSQQELRVIPLFTFLFIAYSWFESSQKLKKMKEDEESVRKSYDWLYILINLISHNLRTPLASISFSEQILSLLPEKSPKEKRQEQYDKIKDSIDLIDDTLNRLLRAGNIADLSELNSAEDLRLQLQKSYPEVQIDVSEDFIVSERLSVALNLAIEVFVDNAIKHGGDQITLSLDRSHIRVFDNGPGLKPDQLERFGDVTEVDSSMKKLHGIGIGFALRLLEAVGWYARAQNTSEGFEVLISVSDGD